MTTNIGYEDKYPLASNSDISIRIYFMAHAPVEPQDWFSPTMPSPMPSLLYPANIKDFRLRQEILSGGEKGIYAHRLSEDAMYWIAERDKAQKAAEEWTVEYRKQRLIQWPMAWATAMVNEMNRTSKKEQDS